MLRIRPDKTPRVEKVKVEMHRCCKAQQVIAS